MFGKKIIYLISFLLFTVGLSGQSLLQDTENLLQALDLLNNKDKYKAEVDAKASIGIERVLRSYDRTFRGDTSGTFTAQDLMGVFTTNDLISDLLINDSRIMGLANRSSYDISDESALQADIGELLKLRAEDHNQLDSLVNDASAKALAILFNYDESIPGKPMIPGNWSDLLDNYKDNDLLNNLVQKQAFSLQDSIPESFSEKIKLYSEKIEGPRSKILERLYAKDAVSPADYLSVAKTLERYAIPPVSQPMAISNAAEISNANVRNGFLLSEAAIIQGMFKFVLDRAKDEIVINYLDKMVTEESPELIALFPTVVQQFAVQEFNYSNTYVERLRQAFYEDIQLMTIRLPLLMLEDDYFKPLQGNPVAYNMLTVYSMIGMAQQDASIDEIFPVTHRYIYDSYEEASKETNLEVAEKAVGSPEYDELIALSDSVKNKMKQVYLYLANAEADINTQLSDLEQRFPDADHAPTGNDFLERPEYSIKVLLGDTKEDVEYDLFLLPSLLKGELDSTYIAGFNTIQGYDKFFSEEKTTVQWRAAGLELSRKLSGTWYNDQSIAGIFQNWQKDLVAFKNAVDNWGEAIDTLDALQNAIQEVEDNRRRLFDTITADRQFWMDSVGLNHDQNLAFSLLANLANTEAFSLIDNDPDYIMMMFTDPEANIEQLKLQRKRIHLAQVEERLVALDSRLREKNPSFFFPSPLQLYLTERNMTSIPYGYILSEIEELSNLLKKLDLQLCDVDARFAPLNSASRNNAQPILQTTEMMTHLLYGLRTENTDKEQMWLTKDQLAGVLDGGQKQDIFLGLLSQKMSGVSETGPINSNGLAKFTQLTIGDLKDLPAFNLPDSLGRTDSLAFFRKASFAVNTLNRLLELPLVVQPGTTGTFKPLKEQWPGMKNVPEISTDALNFIYFVNVKDHGRAVSSLIQLFTSLDYESLKIGADSVVEKRTLAIGYLKKYGNFIAGMIDARQSEQVKDLLDQIADEKGSSKTKRVNKTTVGLNAYLGANIGSETWSGGVLEKEDEFISLAPSMPFGFAFSRVVGKKKPQSFSLYLSLIDLGGLFSYRLDSKAIGQSTINFKNVFKPGFQVQWNLMKSPFYIGAGAHFGPQYRTLNDDVISFNAKRFFIGFGVDVPVFTFYPR